MTQRLLGQGSNPIHFDVHGGGGGNVDSGSGGGGRGGNVTLENNIFNNNQDFKINQAILYFGLSDSAPDQRTSLGSNLLRCPRCDTYLISDTSGNLSVSSNRARESQLKKVAGKLHEILEHIEDEDKENIRELRKTLDRMLLYDIDNPDGNFELYHRDKLFRELQDAAKDLKSWCGWWAPRMMRWSLFEKEHISTIVSRHDRSIKNHLLDFLALEYDKSQKRGAHFQITRKMTAAMKGTVKLVDAMGRDHWIGISMATSFEQLSAALYVIFQGGTEEDQVLSTFLRRGEYDLYIDNGPGTGISPLRKENWLGVEAGSTIVMSAIIWQSHTKDNTDPKKYQCPRCHNWNGVPEELDSFVDCSKCDGRYQIAIDDGQNERCGPTSVKEESERVQGALLRNIRINIDRKNLRLINVQ